MKSFRVLFLLVILTEIPQATVQEQSFLWPLSEAGVREVQATIEAIKKDPRGPYLRIWWFCADGTVHPPKGNPCARRGGGVQHAEFNDKAKRLGELHFHVGTIFQALNFEELFDTSRDNYRLKELVTRILSFFPILLAVFDQINKRNLTYTPYLKQTMEEMVRYSSNRAATQLISLVGFQSIADTLKDPRYELYDPKRNGGLWVGKDYGGGLGRWDRDPLHNVSHGATARQVARFFVMLDKGILLNRWTCREMKEILSRPGIIHKFAKGLANRPGSAIYRKSGSWKSWHCDAALVERGDKKYVAVALLESFSAENTLCPDLGTGRRHPLGYGAFEE